MQDFKKLALLQLERGKGVSLIRNSLATHYQNEDKKLWLSTVTDEYLTYYPVSRAITAEEKSVHYYDYVLECETNGVNPILEADYVFSLIEIDYSNDDLYMTFDEWINQVVVVSPYVAATYNEDGSIATEPIQEVTELIREFIAKENYDAEVDLFLTDYNSVKGTELDTLIVTISTGKRFYTDPQSRADLGDAISILMENGLSDYYWKTVGGIKLVTIEELREARRLGLQAKGANVGII